MDPIDLNLRVGRLPAASEPTGGELSAAEVDENFTNLRTAAEQLDDEKAPKAKYISTTAPDPAVTTDWFLPTGEHFIHDGTGWFQVNGTPGADGREVELRDSGGYVQWRYVGETSWTNLYASGGSASGKKPYLWA